MAGGDSTGHEFHAPTFVPTRRPPGRVARGQNDRLMFTLVTDGIERHHPG